MTDSLIARAEALEAEAAHLRALARRGAAEDRAALFYEDKDAALAYEDYMEEDRVGRIASERYHAHREEY